MVRPTYVVGHRNPDTDAIVAAIAYAELLRLTGWTDVVPARAGEPRPETIHLLERFGLELPRLLADVRVRVGDVMTSPASTVSAGDSLYEVGRRQQELGMRPLPVIDDGGRLCGMAEARDFAKVFFQGLDPELADQIPVDVDNIVRALGARVLVASPEPHVRGKVMVAAWSHQSLVSRFEPGIVLVVGDREDVQRAAIEYGVGLLVVTGNSAVAPELIARARQRDVTVLAVEHHSAATLRLIHMSIPVSYIMRRDPPSLEPDDLIEDVRDLLGAERAVSVVDEGGHVVGVVTRADVLRGGQRRVVLVDHNERGQAVEGIEQAEIVGVIDHHRVADLQTAQPPMMRVEPLGACSSVVAKLFEEADVAVPAAIAGAMLGAILMDTLLFKSPTTTQQDRRIAARLATTAGVDTNALGEQLIAIASDVSERTARSLVTGDLKTFDFDGQRFGIGVIETGDAAKVLQRRDELIEALAELRREGYATVLLIVTDVVHEQTTVLVDGNAEAVARGLGAELGDDGAIHLRGVYSRKKQVVPALGRIRELMATGARP